MAARKALTKRQKANRAKKARAFIGPMPENSQHRSHATRRAKKAATASVTVAAAGSTKPRVKVAMGSRPAKSAGVTVYKAPIGPKPENSQHRSHATRRAKKAAAANKGTQVYDKPIGPKMRIKVAMGSRPAASKGGGGGRSAAAKKAWATRRANGWKAPSRKKG